MQFININLCINIFYVLFQDDAYNSNDVEQAELKWDGGENESEKPIVEEI